MRNVFGSTFFFSLANKVPRLGEFNGAFSSLIAPSVCTVEAEVKKPMRIALT